MKKIFLAKHVYIYSTLLIIIALLFHFHFRGMTYYDEGYVLNAALRTLHGEIPYRDFDMVYTPLSFVVTSWFLYVFGESVLSERVAALVISLLSLAAIYFILKQFTKNIFLIFGSLLFFISWGPTHTNFAWPTMFAVCFLLYSLLFYLYGINRKSKKYFYLAGLMTILVFLSKQNFGTGIFLVLLLSFLFMPSTNKKPFVLHYLFGVFSASGVYVLYLVITSSIMPFIENMYLYTLKRVILDKGLDTPFLYEGTLFAKFAKLLFYISPLVISFATFLVLFNKHKKLLFIPLAIAVFYLLGVRPTTDYVHVSPLIAIACLPLTLLILFAKKGYHKKIALILLFVFTGVGLYTAYFKGYYQWEAPIKEYMYLSGNPRVNIYLKEDQVKDSDALQTYVDSRVKKDEYIFVNYYAPLVYFITDRENPTPYDLINTLQLPNTYQQNIIKTLQEKKVKLVMLHEINKNENSIVSNYIRKNYRYTKTVAGFLMYEQ